MATGRSDYPNQINNVLAFPGIFRGALDVRAPQITEEMKLAAAAAIAAIVPDRELRRSEEHTSELQSRQYLVCRLLLEKKKKKQISHFVSTFTVLPSHPYHLYHHTFVIAYFFDLSAIILTLIIIFTLMSYPIVSYYVRN